MVSIKLAFVAFLAILGSTQLQAAHVEPSPQPQSLIDLVLALLDLLSYLILDVGKIITDIDGPLDTIQKETTPDLSALIEKLRSELKDLLEQITTQAGNLFTHGNEVLEGVRKNIQDCIDAVDPQFRPASEKLQNAFAAAIKKYRGQNQATIDDARQQISDINKKIVTDVRNALDQAGNATIPGTQGSDEVLLRVWFGLFTGLRDVFKSIPSVLLELLDIFATVTAGVDTDMASPNQEFNQTLVQVMASIAQCIASKPKPVVLY